MYNNGRFSFFGRDRSIRLRLGPFRSFDRSVHFGLELVRYLKDRSMTGTLDRSMTVRFTK